MPGRSTATRENIPQAASQWTGQENTFGGSVTKATKERNSNIQCRVRCCQAPCQCGNGPATALCPRRGGTNAAQRAAGRCQPQRDRHAKGAAPRPHPPSRRHVCFSSATAASRATCLPFSSGKGPCSASCSRSASGHWPCPVPWATSSFGRCLAGTHVSCSFNLEKGSCPPERGALVWDEGGAGGPSVFPIVLLGSHTPEPCRWSRGEGEQSFPGKAAPRYHKIDLPSQGPDQDLFSPKAHTPSMSAHSKQRKIYYTAGENGSWLIS